MSKETRVFEGTVVEKTETLASGSGALLKIHREPLIFRAPITAVSQQVAEAKLIKLAEAKKEGLDLDNLEIFCSPFCG